MDSKERQNKEVARNRARSSSATVDTHVGARVRELRTMLGISQKRLADAVGISFQQIQKYECGANRIGAGRLYHISTVLGVPISYFFEGISPEISKAPQKFGRYVTETEFNYDLVFTRETLDLLRVYCRIKDPQVRRRIFDLIRQIGKTN